MSVRDDGGRRVSDGWVEAAYEGVLEGLPPEARAHLEAKLPEIERRVEERLAHFGGALAVFLEAEIEYCLSATNEASLRAHDDVVAAVAAIRDETGVGDDELARAVALLEQRLADAERIRRSQRLALRIAVLDALQRVGLPEPGASGPHESDGRARSTGSSDSDEHGRSRRSP